MLTKFISPHKIFHSYSIFFYQLGDHPIFKEIESFALVHQHKICKNTIEARKYNPLPNISLSQI